jgi:hypothetical protein
MSNELLPAIDLATASDSVVLPTVDAAVVEASFGLIQPITIDDPALAPFPPIAFPLTMDFKNNQYIDGNGYEWALEQLMVDGDLTDPEWGAWTGWLYSQLVPGVGLHYVAATNAYSNRFFLSSDRVNQAFRDAGGAIVVADARTSLGWVAPSGPGFRGTIIGVGMDRTVANTSEADYAEVQLQNWPGYQPYLTMASWRDGAVPNWIPSDPFEYYDIVPDDAYVPNELHRIAAQLTPQSIEATAHGNSNILQVDYSAQRPNGLEGQNLYLINFIYDSAGSVGWTYTLEKMVIMPPDENADLAALSDPTPVPLVASDFASDSHLINGQAALFEDIWALASWANGGWVMTPGIGYASPGKSGNGGLYLDPALLAQIPQENGITIVIDYRATISTGATATGAFGVDFYGGDWETDWGYWHVAGNRQLVYDYAAVDVRALDPQVGDCKVALRFGPTELAMARNGGAVIREGDPQDLALPLSLVLYPQINGAAGSDVECFWRNVQIYSQLLSDEQLMELTTI